MRVRPVFSAFLRFSLFVLLLIQPIRAFSQNLAEGASSVTESAPMHRVDPGFELDPLPPVLAAEKKLSDRIKAYLDAKYTREQSEHEIDLDLYLQDLVRLFTLSQCGHYGHPIGSTEHVYQSKDPKKFSELPGTVFVDNYSADATKDHFKLDHVLKECACGVEPHYPVESFVNSSCFKRDFEESIQFTKLTHTRLFLKEEKASKPNWHLPEPYYVVQQWYSSRPGYEIHLVKRPTLPPIDFFLVLDDSSSMEIHQERMRKGFLSFSKKYFKSKYDFHFLRGTTSTYETHKVSSIFSPIDDGECAEEDFKKLIEVGGLGNVHEYSWDSFDVMTKCQEAKMILRESSVRVILFLTDEERQGQLTAAETKQKMDEFFLKNSPDAELNYFVINIIDAEYLPQFEQLNSLVKKDTRNFTGGLSHSYSIYEDDYSQILEDIHSRLMDFLIRFAIREIDVLSAPECDPENLKVELTDTKGLTRTLGTSEFKVKGTKIRFSRFLNEYLPSVEKVRAYCPRKVSTHRGVEPQ